ncbi:MAG: cellulose biosynthesis cyclic di-GMP-binding regulatory protein BcsB [Stagnimonas sp.]|nr:cellulose biosynthesis cyclic di-GMP-binding regulatory protein BcsB [Stagnimonas sp.]
MRRGLRSACLLGLLGLLSPPLPAAEETIPPEAPAPPAAAAATVERRLLLGELGGSPEETLKGVEGQHSWSFGLRLDQTVQQARLRLRYSYSPALLAELSHLKIQLNGVVVATLPLPRETNGAEQTSEFALPSEFFTDYNQLNIQLIGHYSTGCEDPLHSSLWASINGASELQLRLQPLALSPDLARLPAPLFDERDAERLRLPFVFPATPSLAVLQAAGVAATWFGALADYRGAEFPVLRGRLPKGHAVVFATNDARPDGLDLPAVQQPTLRMLNNPADPYGQLLVVQGRDASQLQQAVTGLALGSTLFSGPVATMKTVELPPRRQLNDAPRWLPTDRPARLGELVQDLSELQVFGHAPGPINVRLRVAPDLFTWNRRGVPLKLGYRYTPPLEDDNSLLTVSANKQVISSFRLKPGEPGELSGVLRVPPYLLGADNSLQFQFGVDYHRPGPCRDSGLDLVRSSLDPEASTIDVSGFDHYALMPNLRLFANGGHPYTRYADLAETALLLPTPASDGDLEAAFQLLGRMGAVTGAPGLRLRLAGGEALDELDDRDLLLIGNQPLLERWRQNLPAVIEREARSSGPLARAGLWFRRGLAGDNAATVSEGGVSAESGGGIGALVGFESPARSGRSVVALVYNSEPARQAVLAALASPGAVARIRGDTAVIRGSEISVFSANGSYAVGRLSPLTWLWLQFSLHPWLVVGLVLLAALLAAAGVYGYLRRLAARRIAAT